MKGVGVLVGNDLGVAQAFFGSLKETMLKHRQMRKLGLYEWSK